MATRAGDLDPGVLVHLLRHGIGDSGPLDADAVEQLVNHRAGLAGISGGDGDMRALLDARRAGDARATLAIASFCRTITARIGGLAAVLGGIDSLVFTGGIGEHAAEVRAEVCAPLGFLGVDLDEQANATHAPSVSSAGAAVTVRIVVADEERVMARLASEAMSGRGASRAPRQ